MFIRIGSIVFTEASFRRLEFHEDGTATLYLGEMHRCVLGEESFTSESREIPLSVEAAREADQFFSADRRDHGLEIYVAEEAARNAMALSQPSDYPRA